MLKGCMVKERFRTSDLERKKAREVLATCFRFSQQTTILKPLIQTICFQIRTIFPSQGNCQTFPKWDSEDDA